MSHLSLQIENLTLQKTQTTKYHKFNNEHKAKKSNLFSWPFNRFTPLFQDKI